MTDDAIFFGLLILLFLSGVMVGLGWADAVAAMATKSHLLAFYGLG